MDVAGRGEFGQKVRKLRKFRKIRKRKIREIRECREWFVILRSASARRRIFRSRDLSSGFDYLGTAKESSWLPDYVVTYASRVRHLWRNRP